MTTVLTLSYPPSANKLWRAVPGKGVLKSGHYRAWLALVMGEMLAQRPKPVLGLYRLTIVATRPDRRARDLDNLAKPLSDALKQAGVIQDDSMANSILLAWSAEAPRKDATVRVTVEPYAAPQAQAAAA